MILEMRNICKDYPMGKTVTRVLRDVSLNVSEGGVPCHHGTLRQRQDHADEHHRLFG